GEFEPTAAGDFEATLTTVSDAEFEAVSVWTATAEVEGSSSTPDTKSTCLFSPITLFPKVKNLGTNALDVVKVEIINVNNIPGANMSNFVVQNPQFQLAPAGQDGDEKEIVILFTPS